ncbi:MAG TPA: RiPP maturation radical SAM C-methyltransferase [Stellaceae bacterium]|jgi:magnesium-protoporphyrin IX monomethyl ester (oxidative) cyclase
MAEALAVMQRIALINMPFAALNVPSLALTQLQSVLRRRFGARVAAEIVYLNHDFVDFIGGPSIYQGALSIDALTSGIGEWFFRQSAFPDLSDNSEEFFRRYQYGRSGETQAVRRLVEEKRPALDAFLDGLIDRYGILDADIVGFTSFFSQNVASLAMAQRLKRRRPEIVTVLGGPNCETVMGQVLAEQVKQIDYVFSGPALESFPRFVAALAENDRAACERIDGVFSKANRDHWANCPQAAQPPIAVLGAELDIDEPVALDYQPFLDLFQQHFPNRELEPALFFETSRGCWWGARAHCTFCGLNGGTMDYRAMKPQHALDLMNSLFVHADRVSRFDSVDNIMPKEYLTDVFPKLAPPPNVRLFYEVKADLSAADLRVLAKAGVKRIQPGIEALATSTLKLMRKGTTAFQNLAFLKNCRQQDVFPIWNLLVGFPGEGAEVYSRYVAEMEQWTHLPPPGGVFPVRFDRFSPYFTQAKEYGLELEPFDFYGMTYPFDREALANLAYYFLDHNGEAEYIVVLNQWLGRMRDEFAYWNERWYGGGARGVPRLYLDGATVIDTRGDADLHHALDEAELRVLTALAKPLMPASLATELGLATKAVDTALQSLAAKMLVFEERGRYLSLVLPEKPPAMSIETLYGNLGSREITQETWQPAAAPKIKRQERRPARRVA